MMSCVQTHVYLAEGITEASGLPLRAGAAIRSDPRRVSRAQCLFDRWKAVLTLYVTIWTGFMLS